MRAIDGWPLVKLTGDSVPRVEDVVLGEKLGYSKPRDIVRVIEKLIADGELSQFRSERRTAPGKFRGNVQEQVEVLSYFPNEEEAVDIIMASQTKAAYQIRREIRNVFVAWNHGTLPAKPDTLDAVKRDDGIWVGVKRACENVGISADAQRVKLAGASWARTAMIDVRDSAGRTQATFVLHLSKVPMWLATITASKVDPAIRPKLERYQNEAADVLAAPGAPLIRGPETRHGGGLTMRHGDRYSQELAAAVLAGKAVEVDHGNGVRCPHFPSLDWIARNAPAPKLTRPTAVELIRVRLRRGADRWEFDAGRCPSCGKVYVRGLRHLTSV